MKISYEKALVSKNDKIKIFDEPVNVQLIDFFYKTVSINYIRAYFFWYLGRSCMNSEASITGTLSITQTSDQGRLKAP